VLPSIKISDFKYAFIGLETLSAVYSSGGLRRIYLRIERQRRHVPLEEIVQSKTEKRDTQ
jgi:hypothetical protein